MRADFRNLIIILSLILFYRIYVLYTLPYDFYFDEAYYWFWSKNFDFGYYSKPPMIAWVIALSDFVCGESLFCIKLPFAVFYFLSSLLIYFTALRLYDKRVAFYSSIAFFTLPSVFLSSIIAATDGVFLFFWALSLFLFLKALREDRLWIWISLGVSGGFGLLSKYTMILFLAGALIYLAFRRRDVFKSRGFYISLVIAFLIFLPNLWWNFQNGFVTFLHTKENADIHGKLFHLNTLFEFLGSQLGVFGPIFFPILLYLLVFFKRFKDDERYLFLVSFITPLFLLITALSYISRAHANWSAPIYIAASILTVWYMLEREFKKLLYFGIVLNIFLGLAVYNFDKIADMLSIELTAKNDPFKKVRGWAKIAKKIDVVRKEYDLELIFDDRMDMSEMIYYLKPHPLNSFFWNPEGKIENYFALVSDLKGREGESFLFVTKKEDPKIGEYFKRVKLIKVVEIPIHKDYFRRYFIFLAEDFKGYKK